MPSAIFFPPEARTRRDVGGKAGALAALDGLPIPPWFVVMPDADVQTEIIQTALKRICPNGELVAVRSSAQDEDGTARSFAGLFESFLNVAHDEVVARIEDVRRSAEHERVRVYQAAHQLNGQILTPAVIVQRMVKATVSGVAFGADPLSGRRGVRVVSAVAGLGDRLVSGEVDADTYHIDRSGTILHHDRVADVLRDEQVQAVADLVTETGRRFGRPQDIEWAFDGDQLYLLQSRPITTLAVTPDPDGQRTIWDNSNIVESYGGVTTPLTFTFARQAYEAVYREFCRLMRVPESVIAAHDTTFAAMIGLIRGRIYYNLVNWYRVLAMLPGFKVNRSFMEQMMGVKESLPDDVLADLDTASFRDRLKDSFFLLRTVLALIRNHRSLPRRIDAFYDRLNTALVPPEPGLDALRADELVTYYRLLERRLLRHWDAPLVNDFFAMIFYGVLGKLVSKWLNEPSGSLQNDLLSGEGGMISTEPARLIREMATLAAPDDELVETLISGKLLPPGGGCRAATGGLIEAYLDRFGDRCLEELKLESPTLHDDPTLLYRSVGQLARRLQTTTLPPFGSVESELRTAAEQRVTEQLKDHPIRRLLFRWVLKHARHRVRDRENLRFERTRVFGRTRRIFLELGRRFYAADALDDPRDVFYLELHEVLGFVDGTATTTDLKGLVAMRKATFETYRTTPAPPDRFETFGAVNIGNAFEASSTPDPVLPERDDMQGTACCPGRVQGRVRIVTDPRTVDLQAGEILVAERTDPGWIMLFPACSGLLIERGSLLSHAAIVSREMALPSIVGLTGVTTWLRDGDLVEMDGRTGRVRRLGQAAPPVSVEKPPVEHQAMD